MGTSGPLRIANRIARDETAQGREMSPVAFLFLQNTGYHGYKLAKHVPLWSPDLLGTEYVRYVHCGPVCSFLVFGWLSFLSPHPFPGTSVNNGSCRSSCRPASRRFQLLLQKSRVTTTPWVILTLITGVLLRLLWLHRVFCPSLLVVLACLQLGGVMRPFWVPKWRAMVTITMRNVYVMNVSPLWVPMVTMSFSADVPGRVSVRMCLVSLLRAPAPPVHPWVAAQQPRLAVPPVPLVLLAAAHQPLIPDPPQAANANKARSVYLQRVAARRAARAAQSRGGLLGASRRWARPNLLTDVPLRDGSRHQRWRLPGGRIQEIIDLTGC